MELTDEDKEEQLSEFEVNEIFRSMVEAEIAVLYWPVLIQRNIVLDR